MGYYDYIAKGYDELHYEEQMNKLRVILERFDISRKKVLDVGCGTAFYSHLFKDYTGIDNSREMVKRAKGNVLLGNAESLPFNDKSFDVVISLSAAHNFSDFRRAIDEMFRVSRELVIVSLFKRAKLFNEIREYFGLDLEIDEEKDLIMVKFLNK
jgi:ubiquinone/menaquinone biosynthesis C-methylase UbiE